MAVSIDELHLSLSGLSSLEGERLAHLVAEKLGQAAVRVDRPQQRQALNVEVPASPGSRDNLDALADRVVEDLVRQLQRQ